MFRRRVCDACTAKDAEIQRLAAALNATRLERGDLTIKVLELARDAAGLTRHELPSPPPADPLAPELLDWLDARFVPNTALWKQQVGQARKLVAEGKPPEKVVELLSRGQLLEL